MATLKQIEKGLLDYFRSLFSQGRPEPLDSIIMGTKVYYNGYPRPPLVYPCIVIGSLTASRTPGSGFALVHWSFSCWTHESGYTACRELVAAAIDLFGFDPARQSPHVVAGMTLEYAVPSRTRYLRGSDQHSSRGIVDMEARLVEIPAGGGDD